MNARSSLAAIATEELDRRVAWLASLVEQGLARRCAIVTTAARWPLAARAVTRAEGLGLTLALFTDRATARTWARSAPPASQP